MNTASQTGPIAFIGLGHMGSPMARNLIKAAPDGLRVFDADTAACKAFAAEPGATVCSSAAEAASGSAAVVMSLPNGKIVASVLSEGGVLDRLEPGGLVIDMSSSAPGTYAPCLGTIADRQLHIVDAPVSGGVARAETGALSIMAGGTDEAVEQAMPLLQAMGTTIFHTGPLGSGQATKALNNLLSAGTLALTVETLLLGRKFGLDLDMLTDVLNVSTGRNNSTDKKIHQFVLSRSFASGFALALMQKDIRTALDMVEGSDEIAPLGASVAALWTEAAEKLEASADHTQIAELIEQHAGLRLD